MLVYGKNVAREVLQKADLIKKIFISENFDSKEIMSLIKNNNLEPLTKEQSYLDKLVKGPHQGIIIEMEEYHFKYFEDIKEDDDANFIVILDHIEDPRNFGAIIRTCECAGVDYIIIPNKRTVEITNTVMKTSSGALMNQKICKVANLRSTMEQLKKLNYWIIGTDSEGTDYTKIDYKGKVALVIGSEGSGLKQITRRSCDIIASIPLKGKVNSLNASVAAGIMIYEVLKNK